MFIQLIQFHDGHENLKSYPNAHYPPKKKESDYTLPGSRSGRISLQASVNGLFHTKSRE